MTEPKELAETIWLYIPGWFGNLDTARKVVKRFMPDETATVIDNVASELVALGEENKRKINQWLRFAGGF